jgi:hypothetical protein
MQLNGNASAIVEGLSSPGSLRALILWFLVGVYAVMVVVSSMAMPVDQFDDAIPLVHGVLVQNGAVPGIDFPTFYPPLGPYISATAFRLVGRTVIATRLFSAGIYLLILGMVIRFLLRQFQRMDTKTVIAVLVVAAAMGRAIMLPAWPGFGLSAVGLFAYLLSDENGRFGWAAVGLSGAVTGLALLYRVNFGGYVAAAVVGSLVIGWCSLGRAGWRERRWKGPLFTAAAFTIPMLLSSLGFCFAIYGKQMGAGISQFTLTAQKLMLQRGFIDLKLSAPLAGKLLFPVGWFCLRLLATGEKLSGRVLSAVGICVGLTISANIWGDRVWLVGFMVAVELACVIGLHLFVLRLPRLELVILLLYCCHIHYYLSRADNWHSKFLLVVAAWLLPFLLLENIKFGGRWHKPWSERATVAVFAVLVLFVLAFQIRLSASYLRTGMSLLAEATLGPHISDSDRVLDFGKADTPWASVYDNADELQAIRYLRRVSTNAEPIFVGVPDHSRVYFSNLRFYWLSGRPIGVGTFQLETKIATEEGVQREIIQDLNQRHVRWAIIDRNPIRGDETFARRAYVGSTLLDQFILANFQKETHFGPFALLTRRMTSLP